MYTEISNPMDYHAALYIRLSKEDENEGPSESVTNQKSLLDEFVKKHRLTVYDTYIDDGFSGTDFNRPDFMRMIGDIESHKVNMVITKDLSRLGRDYIMTGHYMERYFPEKRVRYISLLDGIDTGIDSTSNDITPFRAIMNDMYAKDISKKIRSVKHDKQRKGDFIGWKPTYGYMIDPNNKNKLIFDEEVAPVVRRIFVMALEGMSCRQIAVSLNEDNIPSPSVYAGVNTGRKGPYSGMWSSERIADMLQNETYIGNMVQGRIVKVSYKSKKCLKQDKDNWVVVEGTHEGYIDRESFDKIGKLIESRRYTRSRTYDVLLKGLLYCHECGYPMGVINRRRNGHDNLYFVCRTYQRFTSSGICTGHLIKENTITDAVIAKVREKCMNYLDERMLLQEAIGKAGEILRKQNHEAEIHELSLKIENITSNMDKMYMDKLNGLLSESDFERIYQKFKSDRLVLERKHKELEAMKDSPISQNELAEKLVRDFVGTASITREVLVSLIERIEITQDKEVIIKFRFSEIKA